MTGNTSTSVWDEGLAAYDRRQWSDAVEQLMPALETPSDVHPSVLEALGNAIWWHNEVDQAVTVREHAFRRYLEEGDHQSAARVALELAHDHALKLRGAVSGAWLARAEELTASEPDSISAGLLARLRGRMLVDDDDAEAAVPHLDEAIRIARVNEDHDLEMLVTHDQGQALVALGQLDEGMRLMEKAMLAAASASLSPDVVGKIYCNMIQACLETADYGAAAQWSDDAERWCEEASADSSYPGVCQVRRSEINRRRGLLDAAERGARKAAESLGHFVPFVAEARAELGFVHLHRGELDEAEAEFDQAHDMGHRDTTGFALVRRARGDTAGAADLIRSALGERTQSPLRRARLLPNAIEILVDAGDVDGAGELVDELEQTATEFRAPALQAASDYARGRLFQASGDHADAVDALRRAHQAWASSGMPFDAARARYRLAVAMDSAGAGESARLEARAAAKVFDRLGATLALAEVEEFLVEPDTGPDAVEQAADLLGGLDVAVLGRFLVVGAYARFDEAVRNELADARQRIMAGLEQRTGNRENHLVWAAPGSGKTFFVQQVADELEGVRYEEINLAQVTDDEFRRRLDEATGDDGPCLVLIDEVDAKPDATWPYEILLPHLDVNVERGGHAVFVMAGSSGARIDQMKDAIRSRPKGADLLSRTPTDNDLVVAPLGVGDQFLVALSQMRQAATRSERRITAVEKCALYYVAATPYLANARQLSEFVARAMSRMPVGETRLKFDHLFSPGDPENKNFWLRLSDEAAHLIGSYTAIE